MAIVHNLHHTILRARANDRLMTYFYAIIIIFPFARSSSTAVRRQRRQRRRWCAFVTRSFIHGTVAPCLNLTNGGRKYVYVPRTMYT